MLREWKKQLLKDKEISRAKHNIGQLREVSLCGFYIRNHTS